MRSRGRITSRNRSAAGTSMIRPNAASSGRSGSGWNSGPRSGRNGRVANRPGSQKRRGRHSRRRPEVRAKQASKGHGGSRPPFESRKRPSPITSRTGAPDDGATAAPAPISTGVQTVTVSADESKMRLDRFFEARFPGLSFSHIQRIIRKGEVRVNGKRTDPKDRLETGQQIRIPPLQLNQPKRTAFSPQDEETRDFLKSIMLYED